VHYLILRVLQVPQGHAEVLQLTVASARALPARDVPPEHHIFMSITFS